MIALVMVHVSTHAAVVMLNVAERDLLLVREQLPGLVEPPQTRPTNTFRGDDRLERASA